MLGFIARKNLAIGGLLAFGLVLAPCGAEEILSGLELSGTQTRALTGADFTIRGAVTLRDRSRLTLERCAILFEAVESGEDAANIRVEDQAELIITGCRLGWTQRAQAEEAAAAAENMLVARGSSVIRFEGDNEVAGKILLHDDARMTVRDGRFDRRQVAGGGSSNMILSGRASLRLERVHSPLEEPELHSDLTATEDSSIDCVRSTNAVGAFFLEGNARVTARDFSISQLLLGDKTSFRGTDVRITDDLQLQLDEGDWGAFAYPGPLLRDFKAGRAGKFDLRLDGQSRVAIWVFILRNGAKATLSGYPALSPFLRLDTEEGEAVNLGRLPTGKIEDSDTMSDFGLGDGSAYGIRLRVLKSEIVDWSVYLSGDGAVSLKGDLLGETETYDKVQATFTDSTLQADFLSAAGESRFAIRRSKIAPNISSQIRAVEHGRLVIEDSEINQARIFAGDEGRVTLRRCIGVDPRRIEKAAQGRVDVLR